MSFMYGLNQDDLSTTVDSLGLGALVERRSQVESKLDYLSFNVAYKHFLNNKLFLSLGLGIEQYTSRFEYEQYTFTSGSRVDTTEIIIYGNGETAFVSEEVPFVTTTINRNQNYLKYRSMILPVGVGYYSSSNEDFNIELEGGLIYHLMMMNRGNVLSSATVMDEVTPLEDLYVGSNHLSSYVGFSISRNLGEQWTLGLGVRAQIDLTNRANNESQLNHKMSSYGSQISLSRVF